MGIHSVYNNAEISTLAKARFKEERSLQRLDGWFRVKEIRRECDAQLAQFADLPPALKTARTMREVIRRLPISISEHAIFAGTQDDAFARSYALINPTFEVNSFTGYCDPTAVFGDIEPNAEFSK